MRKTPASLIDLSETVIEHFGARLPGERPGRSLRAIASEAVDPDRVVFSEAVVIVSSARSSDITSSSTMAQRVLSGRFVLRLDPDLHAELRREAAIRGSSLNAHCVQRLATPGGVSPGFEGATETVRRAGALMGESLVGVAVFGSWARGEPADTSDVDVLIVIDGDIPITRDLYRRWDEVPVAWEGRPVDPHFVHLPPRRRTPSGLWAEVAVDGIVLHDPRHRLFPRLAAVRRALAEGRLRRRTVHGVGYWAEPV